MTEKEIREKVLSIAKAWLGCNGKDGSHKKIIDAYNAHKPLARGYKVKYTDAWCSTFASAVSIKAGMTDIFPTECGCGKHINLFKNLNSWVEDDSYIPAPADVIFYDWEDNGVGENVGAPNHVGIVESVTNGVIKVIEGNMDNKVAYRNIRVNAKYIRGYGVPKYYTKAVKEPDTIVVGDIVQFNGTTHYSNANALFGKKCTKGLARVTATYKGKHPYHIVGTDNGSNVYGWVNAADITKDLPKEEPKDYQCIYTVVKGDSLWNIAKKYLGGGRRYPEIMKLNGKKTASIRVGEKLKIPNK